MANITDGGWTVQQIQEQAHIIAKIKTDHKRNARASGECVKLFFEAVI